VGIFAAETPAPDIEWVISGTPPTLRMNGAAVVAPVKSVTSEVIDLAALPVSARRATANLHVQDTSGGFEAADEFLAYAIFDGNTAAPQSMTAVYDLDASGSMNGAELCPAPAVNPTPQSFDYPLSLVIPAGTSTVQLVFTGLCNSTNETMTIGSILIAPVSGNEDSDGDGVSNDNEGIMGTDPNNAADVLRLGQAAGNAALIEFPTKAGRFYRVYSSSSTAGQEGTHLQSWIDSGTATIVGDGNSAQFPISATVGVGRKFFRLHVMTIDGPWPAQVP
jgi:hypothetical protein